MKVIDERAWRCVEAAWLADINRCAGDERYRADRLDLRAVEQWATRVERWLDDAYLTRDATIEDAFAAEGRSPVGPCSDPKAMELLTTHWVYGERYETWLAAPVYLSLHWTAPTPEDVERVRKQWGADAPAPKHHVIELAPRSNPRAYVPVYWDSLCLGDQVAYGMPGETARWQNCEQSHVAYRTEKCRYRRRVPVLALPDGRFACPDTSWSKTGNPVTWHRFENEAWWTYSVDGGPALKRDMLSVLPDRDGKCSGSIDPGDWVRTEHAPQTATGRVLDDAVLDLGSGTVHGTLDGAPYSIYDENGGTSGWQEPCWPPKISWE